MNDRFTENDREDPIARTLTEIARQTHVNAQFATELEEKLRNMPRKKVGWLASTSRQVSPALRWGTVLVLLGLVLSWSIKSLIPAPQPFANSTPDGFICPVTQPNGSLPPGTQTTETTSDPDLLGNGALWTVLRPGGKAYVFPQDQMPDGSFAIDWPWYRGVEGQLTIEGRRLDGDSQPLRYELPEGFNNFQGSRLIFPSTGCWEITGSLGDASLTFVTDVLLDTALMTPTMITTPDLARNRTPTPGVSAEGGYNWRGGKLFLSEPLPASPVEANVYLLQPDQPATAEQARLLAQRFEVEGEIYEAPGDLPDTTSYMITDGRQRLYVRSENYFTYYADYNVNTFLLAAKDLRDEEANASIDSFLKSHGFDFQYQVEHESGIPGVYDVLPLTAEGYAIRFDHNMPARLQFTLGSGGQVLSLDSSQIDYESVGAYGIRSAEEAFQLLLGNAETIQNGVLESSRSGGVLNESYWERSYPDDQTVTIYGRVTSFPPVEPGKPPFVAIDQHTVTGNTPPASGDQVIAATGQFHTGDGVRTFQVESWQPSDAQETAILGTLEREGDQTVLISDTGEKHVIADAPADVPLNTVSPDEQLMVSGFLVNGDLVWRAIQYFPAGSNFGGGGGGGTGFYKLNLSGTPVPFPTPTTQPGTSQANTEYVVQDGDTCGNIASSFGVSIQDLIDANQLSAECLIRVGQTLTILGASAQSPLVGRQLEKQRGMLSINIYRQQDGTSRPEFIYITQLGDTYLYATLENLTLDEMLPYQNRPLDIWGTVRSADAYGTADIAVDRFEDPYPGLQFEIIRGTQQNSEVDGNPVVLFTAEDGRTYVQMTRDGGLDTSIIGEVGDPVIAEVLIIPDETLGDYPVMRFVRLESDQGNGESTDMQISADKPQVMDASLDPQTYTPPDTTIERVELVYYLPDPRYALPGAATGQQYLQPAWRFAGHRSNGDVFEVLVQALKQEHLLPELQTYTPPG